MMDEPHLMEHVKEAACFVSQDLPVDLAAAKAGRAHRAEYVLPDGLGHGRGFLRPVQPRGEQGDRQEQVGPGHSTSWSAPSAGRGGRGGKAAGASCRSCVQQEQWPGCVQASDAKRCTLQHRRVLLGPGGVQV